MQYLGAQTKSIMVFCEVAYGLCLLQGTEQTTTRGTPCPTLIRDLQIRLRLRVRVRLLSARGLGRSCRGHCCCRRQLATKIFQ